MQLPPTILSLDKKSKKDKTKQSVKTSPPKSVPDLKQKVQPVAKVLGTGSNSDSDSSELSAVEESQHLTNVTAKLAINRGPILVPPRTLETTLFDRLEKMYGPSIKRMLEVQYR